MKFEEVLPALREGKRIRRSEWKDDYWSKDKVSHYSHILCDDWEIIEPTVTITRSQLEKAYESIMAKSGIELNERHLIIVESIAKDLGL